MDTDVPICVPALYILYPVTPTVSVEAVHDRLTAEDDTAVAEREVGVVGAVVSDTDTALVVNVLLEPVARLPAESLDLTL